MEGPGSGGNVLAALCSFVVPGLGQLFQGRLLSAFFQFAFFGFLWLFWLGWIMHLYSAYSAATFIHPR